MLRVPTSKIKGCCLAYFKHNSVNRIWRVGKTTKCLLPITISAHILLLMKKSFTKYTSCSGLSLQNISYVSFQTFHVLRISTTQELIVFCNSQVLQLSFIQTFYSLNRDRQLPLPAIIRRLIIQESVQST